MNYRNPSHSQSFRLSTSVRLGVAAVAACFIAAPVFSNPVNPTVVNGTASFTQTANVLTVTNSNGAIINWDKFSIKAGETTHFAQTAASSSVMNRVLNDPTTIYGTLSSNGRVFLVNPAGIMVGPGGRVDTAGFVASTLNIRNEDFLAGRNLFVNDGAARDIINQGEIRTPAGGSVYLIGSNVSNEGIITTPQGETILAAGATVSLIDSATPGVKVDITGAAGNSTNLGEITAEAGRIGIAGVIVRNSGTLNASSVVNEGGRIFLKASQDAYVDGNGRIVTTGTRGGKVEVLGDRVAVMDSASIDASGTYGGGSIKVGGDYQGNNPEIQNGTITFFGAGASLKADATEVGDGGTVIVWADDTTRAYGTISARGGALGGNGGFVEVSGKNYLEYRAFTDTRAPRGTTGKLLLDPVNITILDSGAPSSLMPYWSPSSDNVSSSIGWDSIAAQLANTAVTITTSPYGGNINFQQSTPWTTTYGGDLTFSAAGSISGNWGGGPNIQPSTGLNLQTAGNISFYGGGGIFLGNGSVVTTGASKSILAMSSGESIGIGRLEALGNVTVNAKYSIWDNNWQTPGGVNIYSNGAISLTSAYGAAPGSTCTTWCSAIQVDTAGSPTSIYAAVGPSAPSGGIGIHHYGDLPSNVSLHDGSINSLYREVSLHATGNINLGTGHSLQANGGGIHLGAGGNILVGGANFYGGPSELTFFAGGSLTVNQQLQSSSGAFYPFLGFAAGSVISVNAPLISGGNIGMVTGVSKTVLENIDSPAQFMALTTSSGTINVNANIAAAGMAGFAANAINITGATVGATNDAWLYASGGATTVKGSSISSTNGFLSVSGNTVSITNSQLSAAYGMGVGSHGADGSCELTGTCSFWGFFESNSYGGSADSGTTTLSVPPYNPVPSLDISGSTLTASNGWLDVASSGNMVITNSSLSSPTPSTSSTYMDPMTSQPVTYTYSNGTFLGAQGNMILTNTSVSAGADVWLAAVGDIRLNSGSSAVAGTDVSVSLGGATSTLYVNDTAGLPVSRVWAKSPSTTYLDFYARSTGGVVIDGIPGSTTTAGGSGFYVGATPVPASPGSGLQIAYSVPASSTVIDPCVTNPDLCKLTDPVGPFIVLPPIVGPGGTMPGGLDATTGGTAGSFGGEEDSKDEKTKKDKKSDEAKDEKKDDKRDQKKVAQCT
ncbi:MAG: filamentous hemagglutinin N-terminal domain-containing protein [Sulfuritalea sp.]|nr:filamentous hemagglutinin N-terminal domain-containing protein [Sulfuritalea sp.]